MSGQAQMSQGPPFPSTVWSLGGTPKAKVDIPITAVLLVLYILGAIIHQVIYQRNNRRGHKFIFSVMLFGFCMARITTTILRIASISLPTNIRLAIAAQIFVAAGVVLIFVIHVFWAQRIVRAAHPRIGWHPVSKILRTTLVVLIILVLAVVITATVQSLYTLRPRTKKIDRNLQIFGTFFLAIISFLPVPIVLVSMIRGSQPDSFGKGSLRTKSLVLLAGSTLLSLGACFRCGTLWLPPVPRSQPLPPYFHKACFYIFNFVIEVLVVYLYAFMRVDLLFYVPDGSHGTYAGTGGDLESGAAADYAKKTGQTDAMDTSNLSVSESAQELATLAPTTPTSTSTPRVSKPRI